VADEGDRPAGEAAAEDDGLPAGCPNLEPAAVRTPEGVELTGRTVAPTGGGATGAGFPDVGAAGARAPAPAPSCADGVEAPISLLARSLEALAASPTRDPESEMLFSEAEAAREAEVVAEGDDVLGGVAEEAPPVADVLAAAPPMPGIPNPAGDVGLAAARAVGPEAGADDGREAGTEAGVDADEGVAEAGLSAGAEVSVEAEAVVDAEAGAEACEVFPDNAAAADVDACDVAPEEVGAEAPLPAESVSTGPSGSNNWSSPRSSSESWPKDDSEDNPVEGLSSGADAAASFSASSSRSESPVFSRLSGLINSGAGSSGLTTDPALREEAPEGEDVAPMGTLPSMGASTGRSVSGSKTGRDAASIVSSPL